MPEKMEKPNSGPTVGIALSGGSGRAIAHIGVLEVLREHKIPIDVITACSSAAVVAGSFACGTMEELKKDLFRADKNFVLNFIDLDKSGKGLFSTDKIAAWGEKYLQGKKFEDVRPRLGFVCGDVNTGELVILSLGYMIRAARASGAVPGIFEPVIWGNRVLVDGGMFSIIPINEARAMGADIVIGVDIAATRQVIRKKILRVWQGYNFLRKSWLFRTIEKIRQFIDLAYQRTMKIIFYNQSDFFEKDLVDEINFLTVLDRAMKLIEKKQKETKAMPVCDIVLSPNVKHFGKMNFDSARLIYLEGRRVALEAIPKIESIIRNYKND
ncbi:MAG: patatin-like phospholipase family protein [bacterium]|nr:patatin-like phospholipase family protein [bacterium]